MTFDEIFELARKKKKPPKNLTMVEFWTFSSARNIYKAYDEGTITLEQAQKEKMQLYKQFGVNELREGVYRNHMGRAYEITQLMIEINRNGCDLCRQFVKLLDGRQPVSAQTEEKLKRGEIPVEVEREEYEKSCKLRRS